MVKTVKTKPAKPGLIKENANDSSSGNENVHAPTADNTNNPLGLCRACAKGIDAPSAALNCDICGEAFHGPCAGLTKDVFKKFS